MLVFTFAFCVVDVTGRGVLVRGYDRTHRPLISEQDHGLHGHLRFGGGA